MKKENKTDFVIVRVTKEEKKKLLKDAKSNSKKFSDYIRTRLGLDD